MSYINWKSKFDETGKIWQEIENNPEAQLELIRKNPERAIRIYDRFKSLGFGQRFCEIHKGNKDYQSWILEIEIQLDEPVLSLNGSGEQKKDRTGVPSHKRTKEEIMRYSHLFQTNY